MRGRKVSFTPDMRRAIVAAYQSGDSTTVLAERYRVSTTPIVRVLREEGVTIRSRALARPQPHHQVQRNKRIIELHEMGYSMKQIADRMGLTRQRVHAIVSKGT